MKYALCLLLVISQVGCVTKVNSRNGKNLFSLPSDVRTVHYAYHGGGETISLDMTDHKPSTTIRAYGSIVGTTSTGLAGIIAAWFAKGVF